MAWYSIGHLQGDRPAGSDEVRLREGWVGVAVEAAAARDAETTAVDEALVEVLSGLERTRVPGGVTDEFGDVVHDAETHAIHHPERSDAARECDHPGAVDALHVAHVAHHEIERGRA